MLVAETNADTFVLYLDLNTKKKIEVQSKIRKTSNDCVFIVRRIKFQEKKTIIMQWARKCCGSRGKANPLNGEQKMMIDYVRCG